MSMWCRYYESTSDATDELQRDTQTPPTTTALWLAMLRLLAAVRSLRGIVHNGRVCRPLHNAVYCSQYGVHGLWSCGHEWSCRPCTDHWKLRTYDLQSIMANSQLRRNSTQLSCLWVTMQWRHYRCGVTLLCTRPVSDSPAVFSLARG